MIWTLRTKSKFELRSGCEGREWEVLIHIARIGVGVVVVAGVEAAGRGVLELLPLSSASPSEKYEDAKTEKHRQKYSY
jgi:hypothetical protein